MKAFVKIIDIEILDFKLILIVSDDKWKIKKIIDENIKDAKEKKVITRDMNESVDEENPGCYIKEWLSRLLLLSDWKNDWDHWDTLNHEVNHLVEYEAKYRWFEEEMEFKAYLQSWLFKKLREILKEYKWNN